MEIKIVKDSINKKELIDMAKEQFGDLLKAVVDVEQEIMAWAAKCTLMTK